MEIKFAIIGLFIYLAMAAWAGSFVACLAAGRATAPKAGRVAERLGSAFFAAGFAILIAGFIYRWIDVKHVPLQNMFEVFLCLGMLMYPLVLFCEKVLGARRTVINVLLGLVVLFPAGFVFHADPERLPPALQSWLFLPHVGSYMLSYIVFALAAVQAGLHVVDKWSKRIELGAASETATYRIIRLGFPLLTLGLVLGALWGKLAWGDYWNWDPKELWSLATFLIYVAYLHVRSLYGARHSLVNAGLALGGFACVIITLLWVNLGRIFSGMHSYAS